MVHLQADDTGLQLLQGSDSVRIPFPDITAAWIVHVGDGFSGPDEYVLVLVTGDTATPLSLEHHSQWLAVRPGLQRALEGGKLFQAEADHLPRAWHRLAGLSPAVAPLPRPISELSAASKGWFVQTMTTIPDCMP
jgi:hypothetical protein